MIGALLRIVLLLIIVAAVAAFFFGYRYGDRDTDSRDVIGTSGETVDVDRARQVGARVGEDVAEGANEVERAAADAALTAKIKSKMALDDSVDALDIDVDTTNGVVTLSGSADSEISRNRAVQLARETDGVRSVVDRLAVQ
jgi:hyperosmotically inducible periplasmic protein